MITRSLSDDFHVKTNLLIHREVIEAIEWCKQNIQVYNPEGNNLYDKRGWAFERLHDGVNFVFQREKDAFMFSLRWQ